MSNNDNDNNTDDNIQYAEISSTDSVLINFSNQSGLLLRQPLTDQNHSSTNQVTSSSPSSSSSSSSPLLSPRTAKLKLKRFLNLLMKLATCRSEQSGNHIQTYCQSLIYGTMEIDEFIDNITRDLHSQPQPVLKPFLELSLPYLRNSLMVGETVVEGIRPPLPPPLFPPLFFPPPFYYPPSPPPPPLLPASLLIPSSLRPQFVVQNTNQSNRISGHNNQPNGQPAQRPEIPPDFVRPQNTSTMNFKR